MFKFITGMVILTVMFKTLFSMMLMTSYPDMTDDVVNVYSTLGGTLTILGILLLQGDE